MGKGTSPLLFAFIQDIIFFISPGESERGIIFSGHTVTIHPPTERA
jgi:hypothetical protein